VFFFESINVRRGESRFSLSAGLPWGIEGPALATVRGPELRSVSSDAVFALKRKDGATNVSLTAVRVRSSYRM